MINKTEQQITKKWEGDIDSPLVSICCTTYNHENFIAEAIDSFLMQETDFPFEILIRDDCSSDKTAAIIKQYVSKFPNIIKPIFEKENKFSNGIKPMPVLLKKSLGKYIALCEGDDYWTDHLKILKQVNFLKKNNPYILSFHNSSIIDKNSVIVKKNRSTTPKDYTNEQMICGTVYIYTNTVMFRNINFTYPEVLKSAYNGDMVLWHILGFYGHAKYQPEIRRAAYRIHHTGIWSNLTRLEQFETNMDTRFLLRKNLNGTPHFLKTINRSICHNYAYFLSNELIHGNLDYYTPTLKRVLQQREIMPRTLFIHLKLLLGLAIKKARRCLKNYP